jgi:hypothetical protein
LQLIDNPHWQLPNRSQPFTKTSVLLQSGKNMRLVINKAISIIGGLLFIFLALSGRFVYSFLDNPLIHIALGVALMCIPARVWLILLGYLLLAICACTCGGWPCWRQEASLVYMERRPAGSWALP